MVNDDRKEGICRLNVDGNGCDYLRILSDLETKLRNNTNPKEKIELALQGALMFYGADRAYVIEVDDELGIGVNTYECCAPGIAPEIDNLQFMPFEMFPRWLCSLKSDTPIIITDLEQIKTEFLEEYRYLEKRSVNSLLAVPFQKRLNAGFLGVDNPKRNVEDPGFLRLVFLLILFSACQMAGYSNEEALRLALKANTQLKPALSEREVQSLLSTAVKKYYKMKNAYIVEKLNLTADEQAAIGISAMPTGAKKRGKNQARDEKIAAKRRKENRMIMRFHILGWSIGTIAKKVNRCYNTVKKRIDEYTEKLEELFSQHEICMLFRQRAKRIVAELKKCATPISFFEDLIYYANMSTLIMNQAIAEGLAYQSEHERKGPRKQDGSCICTHMNAKGWFAK